MAVYSTTDEGGDGLDVIARVGHPEDVLIASTSRIGTYADARALRDALSAFLGEAGPYTASALVEAKADGYAQGIETGRLVERGAMSVGLPRTVSAVEVEIFREAFTDLHSLDPIRGGLEAVENYRTWKAAQA